MMNKCVALLISHNLQCGMAFQIRDDFTNLLMNMIFAELIMALVGIPINFVASIQHGWKMGETVCDVSGFLVTLEGKCKILASILQTS